MKTRGFLLFDIDGVIRDVANSYRLAIKETVNEFCGYIPSNKDIDTLKTEGCWNNDWDASYELIKRTIQKYNLDIHLPSRKLLIKKFNHYYFGGSLNEDPKSWTGFIKNEPLLVSKKFFQDLDKERICWGFVSGSEAPSANFVLQNRIGLKKPPLIAMGEAPEKPNPTGFLSLATRLAKKPLGSNIPPIAYIGDTVADVKTVIQARLKSPNQKFISLAVAPPHLHKKSQKNERLDYEKNLREAGADIILKSTEEVINYIIKIF